MNFPALAFAAVMLAVGVVYEVMGMNMPRGTLAYPGPGFFPTLIGVFLIATAAGCVIQELLGRKRAPETPAAAPAAPPPERQVAKTVQLLALLVGYMLVLKPLGFPIAIAVFVAIAIRIFGYRKWLPTAAMAVVIAAASYVAFVAWLKVPLPLGLLETLFE